MSALLRIQQKGFGVELKENGNILISPASKLTDELRTFIRSHKSEILRELKAANDEPKYKRFVVTCSGVSNIVISPTGITLETMRNKFAKSAVEILH